MSMMTSEASTSLWWGTVIRTMSSSTLICSVNLTPSSSTASEPWYTFWNKRHANFQYLVILATQLLLQWRLLNSAQKGHPTSWKSYSSSYNYGGHSVNFSSSLYWHIWVNMHIRHPWSSRYKTWILMSACMHRLHSNPGYLWFNLFQI